MSRSRELLEMVKNVRYHAEDVKDTIEAWELEGTTVGKVLLADMGVVVAMCDQAETVINAEQDKFPVEKAVLEEMGAPAPLPETIEPEPEAPHTSDAETWTEEVKPSLPAAGPCRMQGCDNPAGALGLCDDCAP